MKLKLILDIEFEPHGATVQDLKHATQSAVDREMGNGAFTAGTAAEIVEWSAKLEVTA